MTMRDYLTNNYAEEIPAWLENWKKGDPSPLHDFLQSRIVFYPGSGYDTHAVQVFGGSGAAHCFVHADYMVAQKDFENGLEEKAYPGYSVLASFPVDQTIIGELKNQRDYLAPEDVKRGMANFKQHPELARNKFMRLYLFERRSEFSDSHGPKRFAILAMKMDAFAVYEALFANRNANLWGLLLQDHGFGGNYDKFGQGGMMERMAGKANVYPSLMLVAANTPPWDGYDIVEGVDAEEGGMHGHSRALFVRNAS